MCRVISVAFLICCFGVCLGLSAEIDTITPHDRALPDSSEAINDIINRRLLEGIDNANARRDEFTLFSEPHMCDEDILYTELRKAIFQSFSASLGLKGYSLDKQLRLLLHDKSYSLPLADSIYRDITFLEGISLNLKELSDVIRVDDQLIGIDKIGHFFSEGWGYFERVREEGQSLQDVLAWGRELEEGTFGYLTTGIFSYGDLVANFQGFRFWNGLRKGWPDPLKGVVADFFTSPQVSCNVEVVASIKRKQFVRQWVLAKPFDIRDYVDGTWNEANNCNSYKDEEIESKVIARIAEVRPGFICPGDTRVCSLGRERYGRYAKELLHPDCLKSGAGNDR